MTCNVVGVKRTDFKPKDGEEIKGYTVYVNHGEDGVDGVVAEKFFLSDRKLSENVGGWVPKPGDKFNMSFNRYGKPDEIKVTK